MSLEVLSGRWTLTLLAIVVEQGETRFSELARRVPGISPAILSQRLRLLETDGLIMRTVHDSTPVRVSYTPTGDALALRTVLEDLQRWAESRSRSDRPASAS
ncbi:helix-turn-helix domain-containing protein [Actinoplanes sp. NPDC023714]|uniref:winged helix-turn-helix transcriptional regulator n=1 Tax=Actinoplanes sp. NPDC023714 TaxID=3154322 RepID=UPI00340EF74A